jgi:hypothetical protein
MPDDGRLWDLWAEAVIDCEHAERTRCLRGPNAEALPADAPIFTVTAYNPNGIERDEAVNAAAEQELEQELTSIRAEFWPATGRSPDGSWSEPGVAVAGLERADACDLGRRYGQLGVFELAESEVHVVRCSDEAVVRTRPRRTTRCE